MKKLLITGITGSLGAELARHCTSAGMTVYGTVRGNTASSVVPSHRLLQFDLAHEEHEPLPEGLDAVVHCAAATSETTTDAAVSRRVNVEGTQRLLEACRGAGVKRFILISTMSAHPDNPSAYAQSKLAAEERVRRGGMDYVILRPGLIISDAPRGIFHKLRQYVEKLPVIPIIGSNRNLATISLPDLCRAVEVSLDKPEALSASVQVCADESLNIEQIVRLIAGARGQRVRCLTISYGLALAIAKLSSALGVPVLTRDNVYGLQYARTGDTGSMRRILGIEAEKGDSSIPRLLRQEGRLCESP